MVYYNHGIKVSVKKLQKKFKLRVKVSFKIYSYMQVYDYTEWSKMVLMFIYLKNNNKGEKQSAIRDLHISYGDSKNETLYKKGKNNPSKTIKNSHEFFS